jgi:hypothetical protein
MSPPWGGTGYNMMDEYKVEYLYPNFTDIIYKALSFSKNIILFLPRNTSIDDLTNRLLEMSAEFTDDPVNKSN